jgi:hypothetical protein
MKKLNQSSDKNIESLRDNLTNTFEDYKKHRNEILLKKLMDEATSRFKSKTETLFQQYNIEEFDDLSAKNGIKMIIQNSYFR